MKRAIALRLNREALTLIERMQRKDELMLDLGASASSIRIGDRDFPVSIHQEGSGQVYQNSSGKLEYTGDISHRVSMKYSLSEEDKERIRKRAEQAEREKNERRVELLDELPNAKNQNSSKRVSSLSSTVSRKAPAPIKTVNTSPLEFTSPKPTSSGTSTLHERLIHLLALQPRTLKELTNMLTVSEGDLRPFLKKVAEYGTTMGHKWSLKNSCYKDIRIWEWSRYDDRERAKVRANATEAYDKLKLSPNASERMNLIPPKPKLSPQPPIPRQLPAPDVDNNSTTSRKRALPRQELASKKAKTKKVDKESKHLKLPNDPPSSTSSSSSSSSSSTQNKRAPASGARTDKKHIPSRYLADNKGSHADNTTHSSEDKKENDDHQMDYAIESQADLDKLCNDHSTVQSQYNSFKEEFRDNHPLFMKALTHTQFNEDKEQYTKDLRHQFFALGGDKKSWQDIVRRTRQFNETHQKLDRMWQCIEKAFHGNSNYV